MDVNNRSDLLEAQIAGEREEKESAEYEKETAKRLSILLVFLILIMFMICNFSYSCISIYLSCNPYIKGTLIH